MPARQPTFSTRARWIIRTQLAALSPARKHTPGVHTRATGFLPSTGPARAAVAFAFAEARRDGHRHWGPGQLLLGLTAQDQGTAARALQRLGISQEQVRQQAGQMTTGARKPDTKITQRLACLMNAGVNATAVALCPVRIAPL